MSKETDMANHCPRCGGAIRPASFRAIIEVCGDCGQEFWHGQPRRPILTDDDWAVLKAHDASEGQRLADGEDKEAL